MKKRVFSGLVLFGLMSVCGLTVHGEQFGHIAVFLDSSVTEDFSKMIIQLEGETDSRSFGNARQSILWNIHAGEYNLQLIFPDSRKTESIPVAVYPGLTDRITVRNIESEYQLIDAGFADQAGHIFTFDRSGIKSFPGELDDGVALLTGNKSDNLFSYDGLDMSEQSQERYFSPTGKNLPDLALVNISDPFAGYAGEDISLISGFSGPGKMGVESVYGLRDRRFHRIAVRRELPRSVGFLFGSVGFENLEDAAPRWNVDGRLPHNTAENVEFFGGAGFNMLSKFKSDARMYYKSTKRELYEHSYYFNMEHAPREESYSYKGKLSVYGWLADDLFAVAGFGIEGEDDKKGDGVHFDDLEAYHRPSGNPTFDETALFYSWDDINGLTDDVDESRVYDRYERFNTAGQNFFAGLRKYPAGTVALSLDLRYSRSSFRKYIHNFPTDPTSIDIENIGFDSSGVEKNDSNGFADIPRPKRLDISLVAKVLDRFYFASASVDYLLFSPDALAVKNPLQPFGSDLTLDESDMKDAETRSKLGLRFAGGFSVAESFNFYTSFSVKYIVPAYSVLYYNYDFFEYVLSGGGYSYVFGNPDLEPQNRRRIEFGTRYSHKNDRIILSYQHESLENSVTSATIPSSPKALTMYMNSDVGHSDAFILTYQRGGNQFINASLMAQLRWGEQECETCWDIASIFWMSSYPFPAEWVDNTTYRLAGNVSFNPVHLEQLSCPGHCSLLRNIIARIRLHASFEYRGAIRYTKTSPNIAYTPAGGLNAESVRDFVEINLGVEARLVDVRDASLSLRFEVLNLFDRDNYLRVYPTSGLPNVTGWLNTEQSEDFVEAWATPHDSSGLTGEQKYILRSNDPNNFDRPRLFRILARLEF